MSASMARLNKALADDSGDELPSLYEILATNRIGVEKTPARPAGKEQCALPTHEKAWKEASLRKSPNQSVKTENKALSYSRKSSQRQRPLGPVTSSHTNSLLPKNPLCSPRSTRYEDPRSTIIRSSPRKASKHPVSYTEYIVELTEDDDSSREDDDSYTDLSGFIVSDSESIEDEAPKSSPRREYRRSVPRSAQHRSVSAERSSAESIHAGKTDIIVDLASPPPKRRTNEILGSQSDGHPSESKGRSLENSAIDEPFATLRFSPPRSRSPHKIVKETLATPPSSPFKSRLQSPSKRARIPPTPHRPSIDAFWSQEVINDWNDQYSPKKTPKSSRRNKLISLDNSDEDISPSASPRKSPLKSPSKRDKGDLEKRRLFNDRKHGIATSFLAEVDEIISGSQVAKLAESTGGIKIIWSKKLSSTAGRANWRREAIRHRSLDGTVSTNTHHHHAVIELAEKVIDDEHRLINVIAHEYCHLANFMISGIKDNPHGKEFKQWAAKCTKAFKDRGVEVTTKHSYDISYKYIWVCTEASCGIEYKRHSKSIDPAKHTCGACKSKLLQIQPAPRKGQELGKRSEYQQFVKKEYERVKKEHPGAGFGEVMAVLGREFRERKRSKAEAEVVVKEDFPVETENEGVDSMLKELGGLSLG